MTKESKSQPKTRSDSSKTSFSSMHTGLEWQRSFSNDASVQRKPEEIPEYRTPRADFDLTGVSSYPQSPVGVQAKLTIGEPGDKYEQEADSVAESVVNQINSPQFQQQGQAVQRQELSLEDEEEKISPQLESGAIQRQEMPQEDEEEKISPKLMVQRQSGEGGMAATPDVEATINQARGGGQPLADSIREPMEQAFGADFSGVKVHTDAQSDQLNRSIQARAFATGRDVFFKKGEYQPGSRGGQELIAHELTHVVQQNAGALSLNRQQIRMSESLDLLQKVSDTESDTEDFADFADFSAFQSAAAPIEVAIRQKQVSPGDMWTKDLANCIAIVGYDATNNRACLSHFDTGVQGGFEMTDENQMVANITGITQEKNNILSLLENHGEVSYYIALGGIWNTKKQSTLRMKESLINALNQVFQPKVMKVEGQKEAHWSISQQSLT